MNRRSVLLLALLWGCFPGGAHAAPAAADAPDKDTILDEIIISASREKLSVLQQEIVKSEDRFFKAYNQINTRPEYKIRCSWEVHTGTLISQRECKPQFFIDATAAAAREFREDMTNPMLAGTTDPMLAIAQADTNIAANVPNYNKHMLETIRKSPKLLALLREHDALEQHYEAVRKAKFKGHWIVRD